MHNELKKFFKGNELPAVVWDTKYKIKDEKTPEDMFKRIVSEIVDCELNRFQQITTFEQLKNPNNDVNKDLSLIGFEYYNKLKILDNNEKKQFLTEIFKELICFDGIIPGGSMLQGIGNYDAYSTLSNCFVLGQPFDSYPGISEKKFQIAEVMKRRGGAGLDLSTIRPRQAKVHNQAKSSSGPIPFAEGYSQTTKEVAQEGRRGALMISLSINHPDSLEFIQAKQDKSKITGANISVKLTEEFMKAIENKTDFILRFPVDSDMTNYDKDFMDSLNYDELTEIILGTENEPKYVKRIKAIEYWEELIKCAHSTAEPGILFECNWEKYSPDYVYEQYRPISTNPCSEIPMQPFDACRLLSVNLFGLVLKPFTKEAEFNFEKAYKVFYFQQLIADICIDLEIKAIDRILKKIYSGKDPIHLIEQEAYIWEKIKDTAIKGRRCGSGFTALGDALAALNIKYQDSEEMLHDIFTVKLKAELDATIDLSILYGSFDGYSKELEMNSDFIKMLKYESVFKQQYDKMIKYGRRNVSWSTAAPTGSLSILTQTTSGIEPLFAPFYKRRKKVMDEKLERVDFIDEADGQKFTEFFILHPKFVDWYHINSFSKNWEETNNYLSNRSEDKLLEIFATSPWFGSCANDIDWKSRVFLQGIVQCYTTHAISSTINLPENTTVETVGNIYMSSWKHGLKGNTVYREGSRNGILINDKVEKPKIANEFIPIQAPKRPKQLEAHYHTINYKNKTYSVIIGLLNNIPYECFIISGITNLPQIFEEHNEYLKGEISRDHKEWYNFESPTFTIKDLTDVENDEKMLSLNLSAMMRHRIPIAYIIKVLKKTQPIAGSFTFRLIKILSRYDIDIKTGDKCPECGEELRHENGCIYCTCGWSKC